MSDSRLLRATVIDLNDNDPDTALDRLALFRENGAPIPPSEIGGNFKNAVWDDFSEAPNGVPVTTASGHAYHFTGQKSMSIQNGILTQDGNLAFEQGAGYAFIDVGSDGNFLGSTFRFSNPLDPARNDSLCMAFFGPSIGSEPSQSLMHYVFGPRGFEIGYFKDSIGNYTVPRIRQWSKPLKANTDYTTSVVVDHDAGYFHILLPDGTIESVYDPIIREMADCTIANWEVGSSNKIGFKRIWAGGIASKDLPATDAAASSKIVINSVGRSSRTEGNQYRRPPSMDGHPNHYDLTLNKTLFASMTGWRDSAGKRVGNLLPQSTALATEDIAKTVAWFSAGNSTLGYRQNVGLRGRDAAFVLRSTAAGNPAAFNSVNAEIEAGKRYVGYVGWVKPLTSTGKYVYVQGAIFNAAGDSYLASTEAGGPVLASPNVWTKVKLQIPPTLIPANGGKMALTFTVADCAAGDEILFTDIAVVESTVALTDYVEV